MTMMSRVPADPNPNESDGYDVSLTPVNVREDNRDFLQGRFNEPQTTPEDILYVQNGMIAQYLKDIRAELVKNNPDILCQTLVSGQNPITATATDLQVRTVRFLRGGQPVTVYKTYLWTNSAKAVRASFNGLSSGADGFVIPSSPQLIEVPISEMQVALNVAGTIGINLPSNLAADGSVFIYGFAIPSYIERGDEQ